MNISTKQKMKEACRLTRAKRKNQVCKTFEVKVSKSHLSKSTINKLNLLFIETKWLYNHYLSNDPLKVHWNQSQVKIKVKDIFENRSISLAGAHLKQEILSNIKQSILNLSRAKKRGRKVGKLKFKSFINTISLKEYKKTYRIKGNRIKIPNIPYLRVNGLYQLKGYELANAKLIRRAGDYYFKITCFKDKEPKQPILPNPIGIDLGLKHQLTLSANIHIDYIANPPKSLKNKYKQYSKKQKKSKNRFRQQIKLQKSYNHWNNQKKDTICKIVKVLKDTYNPICYQNDNISGWQRLWGRKSLLTSLGGITSRLKHLETTREINRFFPSTKTCSQCNNKKDVKLEERVYHCEACNLTLDRDLNASLNILKEGLKQIGKDITESTPMDIRTNTSLLEKLNTIPRVKASQMEEVGNSKSNI